MLTVHHLETSQSERIVWLFEELEIPYELKFYARRADDRRLAPDEYKKLHPMGIAPVLTDGPLTLAESGAICEYVNTRYGGGQLAPAPHDPDYPQHLFWFHWSNGTYMPILMMQQVLSLSGSQSDVSDLIEERARRGRALIEERLGQFPFFGGQSLTTADIMMVFALTTMQASPPENMPNLLSYLQRIEERTAYRRARRKIERK